jgi:VIT1/CCC1 family predicted Fe2+/Mn2+ transporter
MYIKHRELHRTRNIGWLRAAVLGANDGIVSTASLLIGVAAAHATHDQLLVTGVAGLVAGSMSMATGEYVSVGSQKDSEQADIARERGELAADSEHEHEELAAIYVNRGLDKSLAREVATQFMAKDALGAHVRDELGISEIITVNPLQAALTSAATFAAGAALPLIPASFAPANFLVPAIAASSIAFLATLGAIAAYTGGAPVLAGAARVTFWGAIAMAATAVIGSLFHVGAG